MSKRKNQEIQKEIDQLKEEMHRILLNYELYNNEQLKAVSNKLNKVILKHIEINSEKEC